jgi:hypothetical protein
MGTLDWKWIGIGVVIMIVLNLVAGLVIGIFVASGIEGAPTAEEVEASLSSGQLLLAAALNFLTFAIGGFIVGVKSAGRTIIEPGISAAIAVLIALLIAGNFSIVNLLVAGLVPFGAGVLGGWLGERKQGTT